MDPLIPQPSAEYVHQTNTVFSGIGVSNSGSGNMTTSDIHFNLGPHNHAALLADLAVTDPRDDKDRIERIKGGLLVDSYKWILSRSEFLQWREGAETRQLWIKGDPGKGKTMLLCGIIDELQKLHKASFNIIYFFCQATSSILNRCTNVLRSLIYLLLLQQNSLFQHIKQKYDQSGKRMFQDGNTWDALCKVFHNMLQDASLRKTFIIIDGLDECEEGLHLLLRLIQQIHPYTQIRVLFSSRNWPEIEYAMRIAPENSRLSLELNQEAISSAVEIYTKFKVHELTMLKGYDEDTSRELHQYLSFHSNQTFLWVALVCEQLFSEDVQSWEIKDVLQEFPPGLDLLYQRMIAKIMNQRQSKLCREILAVVCFVFRPISLHEPTNVIESPAHFPKTISDLEPIIGLCRSFLTVRNDVIYFVHQSAKDFLTGKAGGFILPQGLSHQHEIMFSKSLFSLRNSLRYNIYSLGSLGTLNKEIERPEIDPLAPLYYWCVFLGRSCQRGRLG